MHEFVFVLEQTLGHVAHGKNLERVVGAAPDVDATFLRLEFAARHAWQRAPGLGSWSVRASWAARAALRRRLADRPADCVFIHTQVSALLANDIMRRVPTVISLDATPANFDSVGGAYTHRLSHPALEATKRAVNRRAFNAAAAIVTWCRWAADSLQKDYGVQAEKIRVIPPGVDTSIFSPRAHEHEGPARILFVGGDLERKGGLDLLEAVQGLAGRVEVDIVSGSSPSLPGRAVPIRVHRGLRPQSPELVELFRKADVFVLPTRGDCLPQAIAEAMASGLPVVATSVGAITEMVEDGVTGVIVPPASPAALARALAGLVADPQRRQAMGRAGLAAARRFHDMARNNQSILALMADLTQARQLAVSAT